MRLAKVIRYKPYRQYWIEPLAPESRESLVVDALKNRVLELAEARARQGMMLPLDAFKKAVGEADGPTTIEKFIASLARLDVTLLGELFAAAARVAEQEGLETGYRLLANTGADSGQTVFHAHVHVLGGRNLGALAG